MSKIVNGKKYDTEIAKLIADDVYWDGHNMERGGRNTFLYKTPNSAFFFVNRTQWQGESDTLQPCNESTARAFFENARDDC